MSGVLANFISGGFSLADLAAEANRRVRLEDGRRTIRESVSVTERHRLCRDHMMTLCDAVAAGQISEEALANIAFWIYNSSELEWDEHDEVISDTLLNWSCPEVNGPISSAALATARVRLTGSKGRP